MYTRHKKTEARPDNCYAENARNWLWILGIVVVGAAVYAIVALSGNHVDPATSPPSSSGIQVQNIALITCPYCPGILDAQGRCNVRECPIYSTNWGRPAQRQNSLLGQVLIKELALEVKPSKGQPGVAIHSIYIGGNGENAGLQAGDRIRRFNNRRVKDVEQFQALVAQAGPGSNVKINVIRNEKKIKTTVMIGEGEMEGVTVPNTANTR